jgi:hypothetical protein
MPRRFPPPWSIEERQESFIVKDATGLTLAYVYFEDEPQRAMSMRRISRDEARRIAVNFAKLPDLLRAQKAPAETAAVAKAISTGPFRVQYQALRDAQRALAAHLEAEHPDDGVTVNALLYILDDPDLLQWPTGAAPEAVLAICGRMAEVQALLHDHIEGGKHTAADVVAKAQAVLSEYELLRAMFDVGYFPPNTPPLG